MEMISYLSVFYELAKVYSVRKRHFFIDKNHGPHEMKHTQEYCTVLCNKSNIIFCIAIREIDTEILAEKKYLFWSNPTPIGISSSSFS